MEPLRARSYVGYLVGDLANNLVFAMQAMFLMIYYTDVIGLDPAAVGTMVLIVRFWDALADLVAGRLVDLTRSRWGKFRPWLLFASLPLLLSSVALFSMPDLATRQQQYLYAYVSYAALGTLYSLVNIPYGSLATAMTQDPVERAKLGVYRGLGPMIGILFLAAVISPRITALGDDPAAMQRFLTLATLGFVVLGYLLYLVTFASCHERVPHRERPVTLRQTGRIFRANRPLQILCVSNFVFLIGIFGVQGAQAYYATHVLGDSKYLAHLVLAGALATLLAVPVQPRLVARYGKKTTFMIGAAIAAVAAGWLFVMPLQLGVVTASYFVFGCGQALAMSLLFAFEADAVEYGEYTSGERAEGATYAVYSFFRKLSQAAAAAVIGYALTLGDFVPATDAVPDPAQPASALWAIKALIGLGPGVCAVLGMALFARYPLTDDRFRAMVAELRERSAGQVA